VLPGIPALLEALHAAGVRLFLATSKPQVYAERILRHFGLAEYFAVIGGASLDGRIEAKADVIASLVGDREHDVLGARVHGLACIGVTFGYGDVTELEAAGAAGIARSVDELWSQLFVA
jgi:phosphoglycolate phosphatase